MASGELVLTAALAGETACQAEADGDRWRLTGVKSTVPAGPIAGLFLVPAGPMVFLVTPTDSGVTVRRQEIVDGNSEAVLELDDVELGVERALELTARYAVERVRFERPIGTFQAVARRLADGYI